MQEDIEQIKELAELIGMILEDLQYGPLECCEDCPLVDSECCELKETIEKSTDKLCDTIEKTRDTIMKKLDEIAETVQQNNQISVPVCPRPWPWSPNPYEPYGPVVTYTCDSYPDAVKDTTTLCKETSCTWGDIFDFDCIVY